MSQQKTLGPGQGGVKKGMGLCVTSQKTVFFISVRIECTTCKCALSLLNSAERQEWCMGGCGYDSLSKLLALDGSE